MLSTAAIASLALSLSVAAGDGAARRDFEVTTGHSTERAPARPGLRNWIKTVRGRVSSRSGVQVWFEYHGAHGKLIRGTARQNIPAGSRILVRQQIKGVRADQPFSFRVVARRGSQIRRGRFRHDPAIAPGFGFL